MRINAESVEQTAFTIPVCGHCGLDVEADINPDCTCYHCGAPMDQLQFCGAVYQLESIQRGSAKAIRLSEDGQELAQVPASREGVDTIINWLQEERGVLQLFASELEKRDFDPDRDTLEADTESVLCAGYYAGEPAHARAKITHAGLSEIAITIDDESSEGTEPDWSGACEVCGASPVVPVTGLCGPCTFGEAGTVDGSW